VPRSYIHEARKRVGPKRNRIVPIIERLLAAHPDATIALRFRSELELLVSVMLSAQTTDVNVNRVTERLFEKYKRPEDYLAVPPAELERDIFATGFFRQKAKALRWTVRRRTSLRPSSATRRGSSSTRTSGGSPSDWA
jgi:endonuclease-3